MSSQGMGASQWNGQTPNCDVLPWGRRPKFCDTPNEVKISEKKIQNIRNYGNLTEYYSKVPNINILNMNYL